MNYLVTFLCLSFKLVTVFAFTLNEIEITITYDLAKELQIRQCILVEERESAQSHEISDIKKLSSLKIFSTRMSYNSFFRNFDKLKWEYGKIAIILQDTNMYPLLVQSGWTSYKMREFTWLVYAENSDQRDYLLNINDLAIPYDCEFIVIEPENDGTYKLTEIYSVKYKPFSVDFGIWMPDFGLKTSDVSYFYWRREDMNGSFIFIRFYSKERKFMDMDKGLYEYAILGIFYYFAKSMNFQIEQDDRTEDADFVSYDIKADLDPSTSFNFHKDGFGPVFTRTIWWYIKHPRSELHPDFYLLVFDIYTWMFLLSIIIIGTPLAISVRSLKNEERCLVDNTFMMLESCCNQCGNDRMKNISLRIICIAFRINVIFLISLYGADITSFLSLETEEVHFTNVKEFLKDGRYKLQIIQSGVLHMKLEETDDPELKKLYSNFTVTFETHDENIIKKICYEKLAMDSLSERVYPCGVSKIETPIYKFSVTLQLQDNSPFTKVFRHRFLKYYENGITARMQSYIDENDSSISNEVHKEIKNSLDTFRAADLKVLIQVLCIPLVGVALGTIILIGEFMIRYCKLFARVVVDTNDKITEQRNSQTRHNSYFDANVQSMPTVI